ncbi:MAG: hypothetical protein JZU64_12780 [Rhodoferax sp.]|nr:hypothetical protein [Rhodoferax sp.]
MNTLEQPAPTFADVWRMFQETDRKFQESERLMKERSAETDRLMKEHSAETDRKLQETDRIVKNLSKNLGDLGNRLGEFVEHMVAPAVVRLFQAQGIEVHEVHPGVEAKRNGEGIEIDLVAVNDGILVAVECKSKLTEVHVDEHLARMEKLKRLLPAYKNHKALGAVAAMVMSDSVRAYAHSQGLYVLYQNGESVDIGSPVGFNPKAW